MRKQNKQPPKDGPAETLRSGDWFDPSSWEWYGSAAHFCCGRWCRFHMATKVGPWLVSTVGEYVHPRHSGASEKTEAEWLKENWPGEEIGYGRKYETMVFEAGKTCECGCGLPTIDGSAVDFMGANTAGDARENHMALCRKYASGSNKVIGAQKVNVARLVKHWLRPRSESA